MDKEFKTKEGNNNGGENGLWKGIGNAISNWGPYKTLRYNPNSEEYVSFNCKSKEERKEFENNPKFLDENNFRLQIGKMKKEGKKGWTIYNDITLGIGIEYMIKHTKKGHQSIIQIWSDVGKCLNSDQEDGTMSAAEEKTYIENFIQKKFGKRGKAIKVEIGSKKYPEVFDAIENGSEGIIPKEEPKLEDIEIPGTSPLPIIKYLAYHANKDKKENIPDEKDSPIRNLMNLFYRTKPPKYKSEDIDSGRKPGDSDADFYGIVEVGLRLFEVLNGVSIQGGLGRQRVYDKIISVIVNGKDVINSKTGFDCQEDRIIIKKYPALERLHNKIGQQHYKFNQIYINLNRDGTDDIKEKLNDKSKLQLKVKNWGYHALIALALIGGTWHFASKASEHKHQQEEKIYENERIDWRDDYRKENADLFSNSGGELCEENFQEQANIMMAKYNISALNHKCFNGDGFVLLENDIVEMYRDAFYRRIKEVNQNRSLVTKNAIITDSLTTEENHRLFGRLTAEDFMRYNGGEIIDKYHIRYQKPYEHFKQYKNAIENTLEYGDKIDISKYKTKEISTESELSYFINGEPGEYDKHHHKFYRLKIITVYLENGKAIDLIVAKQDPWRRMKSKKEEKGDYNIEDGTRCMKDLCENYIPLWSPD